MENFMDCEPKSLREIAESEGISHQAVAEILERAYRKIRKLLKNKGIRLEDLV
jgi:DNA-directed RNA polymerase sigma subunit (sigma70/sigma32)